MKNTPCSSTCVRLSLPRKTAIAAGLAMVLLGEVDITQAATTRTVVNCNDSGAGSLRQAISDSASGDSVDFDMGQMQCSRITLISGAISVGVANLTLEGPGANNLTIDGNAQDRVLSDVGSGGTLTINHLAITNGKKDGRGGCIYSDENISLIGSTVFNCTILSHNTLASGGGISASRGRVSLVNSTVSGNLALKADSGISYAIGGGITADSIYMRESVVSNNSAFHIDASHSQGGGVFLFNKSLPSSILRSTIAGNHAGEGGGLYVERINGLQITIGNSTFSGNSASLFSGALFSRSEVNLGSSTLAFNHVFQPGAAAGLAMRNAATLTLDSSIIAHNTSVSVASDLDTDGSIASSSKSLVFSPTVAVPMGTITGVCPQLEPLANNGGPTQTHALHHTSPVIDQGSNSLSFTFDQRGTGFPRQFGSAVDIGAYEWQGGPDEQIFHSGFESGCDE